ncbi:MAG: 1,4-alpha-glucan branching protein GlgB [Desulfobulbaceae bacterium]|nr:1,4-alpha-glucan branching protein GlgB [Desulfobulbaceae bacterium]
MEPEQFSPLPVPAEWLSTFDAYLIGEGTHERAYEKMGAHLVHLHGQDGVAFAVWAPNARQVSVIGDFNQWDDQRHPMHPSDSGIWTLFIPGLQEFAVYKYSIITQSGQNLHKADPFGFAMEERPRTGSVVADLSRYQWRDKVWMQERAQRQGLDAPISIYEVHLGSWRKIADENWGLRYLSYRELADQLIPYVVEMGYTHIELLPITEPPFEGSWGYQVLGFFAPTSRFGPPQDFMYFVDQCHAAGVGVILDWVPAHFPKDGAGLNNFDGTQLYAHANPMQGEHQDWGTLIFNYSRNEVRAFLLSNALFWLDKYHIDGLRVDAVASMLYLDYSRQEGQWIPNYYGGREDLAAISFLQKMNEAVHGVFPGILTIAEESTSWPMVSRPTTFGGLGFSCKWNMGWMHDTLGYMRTDPLYRRYSHNQMTFGMLYAFHENFVLPLSHDEVVHGKGSLLNKMPGDEWQKFANLRAMYGYMWAYAGKKLLFMGSEFAQWKEWSHDAGLDWAALEGERHQGVQRLVRDLNAVYRDQASLHEVDFSWKGFAWIEANDADNSVFSFIRYAKDPEDFLVVVCNFTPVVRYDYHIGVPRATGYTELINTDLTVYGGSGVHNPESIQVIEQEWHSLPCSLSLVLPPLATLILRPFHSS